MRIKKIRFENYRQFRDVEIDFEKNMHAILGDMGTGKTNILNAINWCLYGEEPYLSRKSQRLSIVNLNAIGGADVEKTVTVTVTLWAKTRDNKKVILSRREPYLLTQKKEKKELRRLKPEFTVKIDDEKGNASILENESAESEVTRFFPKGIKEFFFFDGERLDRYFKEATGSKIRSEVRKISKIELLDRIKKRLGEIVSDLKNEAGRQNPTIKETTNALGQKDKKLDNINYRIKTLSDQITIAKKERDELEEKIKDVPDVEKLKKERKKLEKDMKRKKDLYIEKRKEKENLLFDHGKIMMLNPAIEKTLRIIEEKRERKEIPPPANQSLLEDILKTQNCSICGRKFGPKSEEEKHVEDLLNEIKSSSNIVEKLLKIENPLGSFKKKIKEFKGSIQKVTQDAQEYNRDIEKIQGEINKINQKLTGLPDKKIAGWYKDLKKHEEIFEKNEQHLGVFKHEKEELRKKIKKLNKELDKELKKEKKVKDLRKYINFCETALNTVNEVKNTIMEQAKTQIQTEGNKLFHELIWKKHTYEQFYIDVDYNLHLKHKAGYEALGTISGGEREVLALSFTMALHKVSGFDVPIFIDRPFAMVSGRPIQYISENLSKLSEEKQVVLLLTHDDYKNASKFWDKEVYQSSRLWLKEREREVEVRVL